MNYFVDTNITIGYTIPFDKWHQQSVNFFKETTKPIYWSNLVKKEYKKTVNGIIDDIEIFLIEVKKILKNNDKDFSNYFIFENFIKKRTSHCKLDNIKKIKILETFWKRNELIEGISTDIYIKFQNFARNILQIPSKRDMNLKNILILHDCGLDNYLNYYDYARELYNNGIHSPDCKVIVDAHDCGLKHEDLVFVSNDVKMIEILSNMDTSHLEIIEFKACN